MREKYVRPSTIEDHKDGTYSVVTRQDAQPTKKCTESMVINLLPESKLTVLGWLLFLLVYGSSGKKTPTAL
jgi:hypothetical protein